MEDKKEKKGFWASLFSPKPCSCSCGMQIIEESARETEKAESEDKKSNNTNNPSQCCCQEDK